MADFQSIRNHYSLIDVALRYVNVEKDGHEYKAICPFHDDHKPSLSFYQGADGNWRYYCFSCLAGSEGGDVIDFVAAIENCSSIEAIKRIQGNDMPDLGKAPKREVPKNKSDAWKPILPVPEDAPKYDPRKTYLPKSDKFASWKPARNDVYRDAAGRILCHVVRIQLGANNKITPTVTYCEGPEKERRWCAKRMPAPYPLMGLDLLAKRPHDAVIVVSGEKCWDLVRKAIPQMVPVTWIGGDNAISRVDLDPLKGRYLTFAPDNDGPGHEAMLTMYNMMIEKNGTG